MPRRPLLLVLACWLGAVGVVASQEEPPARRGPSEEDVREAVEDVFSDPAFAKGLDTTHLTLDQLLELIGHYFDEAYRAIMNWLASLYAFSPLLYFLCVATMIIVGIVLTYHMAWTFTRAFRGVGDGEEGAPDDAQGGRERRYRDLRAEARAQAEAGQPRDATRTLLLALLALLAEERVLRVAHSWTPREIVAQLSALATFGPELASFRAAVEDAAYADHAQTRESFDACERTLDELVPSLRALRRTPAPAGAQ